MAGTWAYAAPEQKRRWAIDIRTDIYAVGLMLRELLTLRTPVDPQVPVESVRNDISPSVLSVLKTALAEDREERWASAREFRLKLAEAFEQSYQKIFVSPVAAGGKTVSTDGMIYEEGGSFLMGCDDVEEESPEREVFLDPFYIDKYPVTVGQYAKYLEAVGAPPPKFWGDAQFGGADQPVIGVAWKEAAAYAAWAGKELPTEAQWEFAARGKDNRTYPWGDTEPDFNRGNFGDYLGMPSIVSMHGDGRTPEGVCDLAGNVYEWTRDRFVPYGQAAPANADEAPLFAARGGCWGSGAHSLRCTHRKGFFPEARTTVLGFRCVLPASQKS
jgi:formylglycine-generating enzyme required for sulfatase activity